MTDIDKFVTEAQTGVRKHEVEPILERLTRLHKEGKGKRARQVAAHLKLAQRGALSDLSAQDRARIRQTTDSSN